MASRAEAIASVAPQVRDLGLGVDGHAVPLGVLPRERVAQPLGAPGDRVLVHVVADRARGGFLQDVRGGEVGETLGEVDRPVLAREPGHAADHGLGEPVGALGGVHERGYFNCTSMSTRIALGAWRNTTRSRSRWITMRTGGPLPLPRPLLPRRYHTT